MDSQTMWLGIAAVVVVLAIAVYAWLYAQRRRRMQLKTQFGPEYDRAVREAGTPEKAESMLTARTRRVKEFDIHPLSPEQAGHFAQEWKRVQAMFVDDPDGAVTAADGLVTEAMTARGYPMEDFEERAADLSVYHPHFVENYRVAQALIARRRRGEAGTEELRQAVMNYRALFEDLLATGKETTVRRAS